MKRILPLLLFFIVSQTFAQIKVCSLPQTSTGTTHDWLIKEDSTCANGTKKITVADFLAHYGVSASTPVNLSTVLGNGNDATLQDIFNIGNFSDATYVEISMQSRQLKDTIGNTNLDWNGGIILNQFAGTGTRLIGHDNSGVLIDNIAYVRSVGTSNGITGGTITSSGVVSGINARADDATKGVAAYSHLNFYDASGIIRLNIDSSQKADATHKGFLDTATYRKFNTKIDSVRIYHDSIFTWANNTKYFLHMATSGLADVLTISEDGGNLEIKNLRAIQDAVGNDMWDIANGKLYSPVDLNQFILTGYRQFSDSLGNLVLDLQNNVKMPSLTAGAGMKALRYNTTTKAITYADTSTSGGTCLSCVQYSDTIPRTVDTKFARDSAIAANTPPVVDTTHFWNTNGNAGYHVLGTTSNNSVPIIANNFVRELIDSMGNIQFSNNLTISQSTATYPFGLFRVGQDFFNAGDFHGTVNGTSMVIQDMSKIIGTNDSAFINNGQFTNNGSITINDGTQCAGCVLKSDASGNASWIGNTSWATRGNTGLSSDSDYFGTNDSVTLVFKQNGRVTAVLNTDTDWVLLGSNSLAGGFSGEHLIGIGLDALYQNTGNYNTAVGFLANAYCVTDNNCAFGNYAAYQSTGANTTFVGDSAGANNTGDLNVAIGHLAGANAGAARNDNVFVGDSSGIGFNCISSVGMGHSALRNASGTHVVAIGYRTGKSNSFNETVALGTDAVASAANQLYISDSLTSMVMKLNAPSTGITYLRNDGSGNASWNELGGVASITSASPATNTTDTVIVKTPALKASRLVAGTVIRITLIGTCTSSGANASTFEVRLGTTGTTNDALILSAATGTAALTGTAIPFKAVIDLTVRSSSTCHGFLTLSNTSITGISTLQSQVVLPTFTSFAAATANQILSACYKTAGATTTSTFQDAYIEFIYK